MRKRELSIRMKLVIFGIVTGVVLGSLVSVLILSGIFKRKQIELEAANSRLQAINTLLRGTIAANEDRDMEIPDMEDNSGGWELRLINEHHPLDISYKPDLIEIVPEQFVDSRIANDTRDMLHDAQAQGMNMLVASAYRSYDQQKEVFAATMQEWNEKGMDLFDAYNETKKSVAMPGTSEHASGLALDIISLSYDKLDDHQGDTAEAQWLMANSWKYGFILRYPPERADVTGIIYEPWHFRYVGKEAAKKITELGITLEEYLGVVS